jgi:hypothetical protein
MKKRSKNRGALGAGLAAVFCLLTIVILGCPSPAGNTGGDSHTPPVYVPVTDVSGFPVRVKDDAANPGERGYVLLGKDIFYDGTQSGDFAGTNTQKTPEYGPITISVPEATVLASPASLDIDWGFDNNGVKEYIGSASTLACGDWKMDNIGSGIARVVKLSPPGHAASEDVTVWVKIKDGVRVGEDYEKSFTVTSFVNTTPPPPPEKVVSIYIQQAHVYSLIVTQITLPDGVKNAEGMVAKGETYHMVQGFEFNAGWTMSNTTDVQNAKEWRLTSDPAGTILVGADTAKFVKTFAESVDIGYTPGMVFMPGAGHPAYSIKPGPNFTGDFYFTITVPAVVNNGAAVSRTIKIHVGP